MRETPERTCIGCGARAAKGDLVRLRLWAGQVEVDRVGRGGRGAWLHASAGCVEKAVRRRAFSRAFRGAETGKLEQGLLVAQLTGSARRV